VSPDRRIDSRPPYRAQKTKKDRRALFSVCCYNATNRFTLPPCSGRRGESSFSENFESSSRIREGVFALQEAILRVLIVEDYEPMRRYIASKVKGQPQLRIVGEVSDGIDAVQKAEELQPDLILMDVGLPTLDGIEATRRIQKVSPKSKILFVTENRSLDIAEEALRSGGLGYVLKSDAGRDLLPAIDAVLRGKRFMSASLTGHLLAASLTTAQSMQLSWLLMFIAGMG
jgi:DNA-binding NarL/FixJ family response regulator